MIIVFIDGFNLLFFEIGKQGGEKMNKEEFRKEYIKRMKQVYLKKNKFEIKKISYNGSYETLKRVSPNLYRALKKLL